MPPSAPERHLRGPLRDRAPGGAGVCTSLYAVPAAPAPGYANPKHRHRGDPRRGPQPAGRDAETVAGLQPGSGSPRNMRPYRSFASRCWRSMRARSLSLKMPAGEVISDSSTLTWSPAGA